MQSKKQSLRINLASFDFLKGLLICQVVLMHTSFTVQWQGNPVIEAYFALVRSPAFLVLPAFYIISGYGMKTREPLKMLKFTAGSLLMPCFWVLLSELILIPICYGLCYYVSGRPLTEIIPIWLSGLVGSLFGMPEAGEGTRIFGIEARFCGPIWFMWAMFTAWNGLNLILQLKKSWQQVAAVLACYFLGYWLGRQGFYYFCIYSGLMAVMYCYMGQLLKKYKLLPKWVFDWRIWLGLSFLFAAALVWKSIFQDSMWNCLTALIYAVGLGCGTVLLVMAGLWLGRFEWKWMDIFKTMGIYSYWIMAIHSAETYWGPWAGFQYNLPLSAGAMLAVITAAWFAIIAAGVFAVKKISRYRYARRKRNGEKRLRQKTN